MQLGLAIPTTPWILVITFRIHKAGQIGSWGRPTELHSWCGKLAYDDSGVTESPYNLLVQLHAWLGLFVQELLPCSKFTASGLLLKYIEAIARLHFRRNFLWETNGSLYD